MASSQPKSQSSYAVASSCVFVTPFDSTKVRDYCLEQFSVACNYDTGLFSYFFRLCCYSPYLEDPCYQVRDEFLRKFITLATHQQLPPHFNVIPFLTVHDPEADIKNMVRKHSLP